MKRRGTAWVGWLWVILLAGCTTAAPAPTPTPPLATLAPVPTPTATTPAPTDKAEDETEDKAEIARGIEAYKAAYCGVRHTLDAANTAGIFGPTHNGMAVTAAARIEDEHYTGAGATPEEYLRESVLNPGVYLVDGYAATRHPMPAYTHLPAAEIDALVYMLLHQ